MNFLRESKDNRKIEKAQEKALVENTKKVKLLILGAGTFKVSFKREIN